MTGNEYDRTRQLWARWAGFLLVATNGTAIVAFVVRSNLMAARDPMQTAANISGAEGLFRLGLAFDLLTVAGLIPLMAGLYIALKPIGRNLAMLGMLWRLVECVVLALLTVASFTALALLGGGAFMRGLDPGAAADLAFTLVRVHGAGFQIAFLFLGLGQLAFSLLWWRSGYVPRWLAGLGILASAVMAAMALGIILWPPLYRMTGMAYMMPMGLYELGLGLWLMVRGLRLPADGSS